MTRFLKTILFCCWLFCSTSLLWSQAPNQTVTLDFDLRQISGFDDRMLFAQQLVDDPRFRVTPAEQGGLLILSADTAFEEMDLEEAFADFTETTLAQLARMDKVEKAKAALRCKASLPQAILLSLMMDVYAQSRENNLCAGADPFCTDNGMYMFPAGVNAGEGEDGPDYDCLYNTPNPAWYYMRIATPGSFTIHMYSEPPVDIDFCCWGPFDDPVAPCPYGLTHSKVVDCSYEAYATENCIIPSGAQTGEYYLLVITNFSNQTCNINFSKTAGVGTTDCSILPPLVDNDGPYCTGETIHLTGNAPTGAVYSWEGPNGWTADGQEVSLPNATPAMTGSYTCTIVLNGQTSSADTYVEVNDPPTAVAQADPNDVTYGTATTLSSSQTTGSYRFQWEPADKVVNPDSCTTLTVPLIEDTRFTLNVTDSRTGCSKRSAVNVWVTSSALSATVSVDDDLLCLGEQTTLHAYPHNGAPDIHFTWSPADGLDDPYSQHPVATPDHPGEYTYTCTVTDGYTSVERTLSFSVGQNHHFNLEAAFCHGDTYDFFGELLSTPGPYSKKFTTQHGCDSIFELELTMLPSYHIPMEDQFCQGDTYDFFGDLLSTPGPHSKKFTTQHGCDSIFELELTMLPSYHIPMEDQFCQGDTYDFFGDLLSTPGPHSKKFTTQHGCDSIFELELTMLPSYQTTTNRKECDNFTWSFPGNNHYSAFTRTYTESSPAGGYVETVPTVDECDSTATLNLQLEYTPTIQRLEGKAWVVGGSEFQYSIESYRVHLNPKSKHHTVWSFGNPDFKRWDLVPHGPNNDSCSLYIYTFETDSIEVVAHTVSDCNCGNDTRSIWIHCGYYDVTELTVRADILPNPNNGTMNIRCKGMTDVEVKVFDATGRLVDRFRLEGSTGQYQMNRCVPGVYCFIFTSREGTLMKKVIIVE